MLCKERRGFQSCAQRKVWCFVRSSGERRGFKSCAQRKVWCFVRSSGEERVYKLCSAQEGLEDVSDDPLRRAPGPSPCPRPVLSLPSPCPRPALSLPSPCPLPNIQAAHLVGAVAKAKVVLDAHWRCDTLAPRRLDEHACAIRSLVRNAPRLDLALGKELSHGGDDRLEAREMVVGVLRRTRREVLRTTPLGHVTLWPVQLVEIDIIGLETLQARLARAADLCSREVRFSWSRFGRAGKCLLSDLRRVASCGARA